MSTKIFDGFRFASGDLREIMTTIETFRVRLSHLHDAALLRLVVAKAVSTYDRATMGMAEASDPEKNHISAAFEEVDRRQKEIVATSRRDPQVDFEFILRLYVDPKDGKLLGRVVTEVSDWEKLWRSEPGILDWRFWNSDDMPSTMDEGEWKEREASWDRVTGHGEGATRVSWNVDLTDPHRLWYVRGSDDAAIRNAVPSLDHRAGKIARSLLMQDWTKANPGPDPATNPPSWEVTGWIMGFADYCQSEEAVAPLEAHRQRIRKALHPDPGLVELRGWPVPVQAVSAEPPVSKGSTEPGEENPLTSPSR